MQTVPTADLKCGCSGTAKRDDYNQTYITPGVGRCSIHRGADRVYSCGCSSSLEGVHDGAQGPVGGRWENRRCGMHQIATSGGFPVDGDINRNTSAIHALACGCVGVTVSHAYSGAAEYYLVSAGGVCKAHRIGINMIVGQYIVFPCGCVIYMGDEKKGHRECAVHAQARKARETDPFTPPSQRPLPADMQL